MIQHFILTRSDYKGRQDVVNGRREITEQITVPSIQAQTRQDFRWLRTGVDVELNLPVAQPDTFEEHSTADVWWSSCVLPLLNPETTHVLTTRMDDDDALTADFVERLRAKVFETDEPTCYVFPNGIVTDRSKWGPHWHTCNMFCSLLTPVGKPLTCYAYRHRAMPTRFETRWPDEDIAWAWVRHPAALTSGSGRIYEMPLPVTEFRELHSEVRLPPLSV